jgi:hypothetical protein
MRLGIAVSRAAQSMIFPEYVTDRECGDGFYDKLMV